MLSKLYLAHTVVTVAEGTKAAVMKAVQSWLVVIGGVRVA